MKKFIYLFALLLMGTSALAEGLVDGDFTAGDWGSTSPTLRASNIDVGWGSGRKWTYDAANNQVELPSSTAPWNGFGQRFASTFTGAKRLSVNWNQPAGAGTFVIQVFGLGSDNNLVTGYITSDAESSQPPTGSGWVSLGYFVSPAGAFNGTSHIDIDMDASLYNDYGVRICAAKNSGAKVTSVSLALSTGPARISYAGVTNEPIKPGELQDVRVIIQNDGLDVSNMVATLTTKDGSLFSVHNGPFSNAFLAANTSFTNTFSVTASNAIMSGIVEAFDLSVTADATDGSSTNLQTTVSIEILDTAFSSIDKTVLTAPPGGTDTAQVTVSNTAAFPLQFTLSSTETWLTHPTGTLTLAPGTPTNITITADAAIAGGDGHYEDALSVTYLSNGSTPTNFFITFDVGPKITPLLPPVFTPGVGGLLPSEYEPGETFTVTITSTNDGVGEVSNIVNTLILPAGWGTPSPSSDLYSSMEEDDSTSTTYTVTIPAGTAAGTYTSTVQNAAAGSHPWSAAFNLVTVYNQSVPSATTNAVTIYVPVGGTASESITLTNAGNATATFTLSDNGSWPFSYLVSTQTASLVTFSPVFDTPDPNTTFANWSDALSPETAIGFNFPFYGVMYSDIEVNRYGQLRFIAGSNDESLMPYWGNTMSETNSVRYKRESDRLVVAWNNRADDPEFQAWIHTDGSIRYVYDGTLPDHDERMIGLAKDGDYEVIPHTPGVQESLLLTPSPEPWITYSPDGDVYSVDGQDVQTITYTANASDQTDGTIYVFTNTITWGDSSTEDVVVTVQVGGAANAGMSVADVFFSGPAGFISTNSMTLVNIGDVALIYRITDTGARNNGYTWERILPPFNWDDSNWDTHSGQFIPTDINEGVSDFIAIGFDFHYYGNVYTQISIGVNGAISLGEEGRLMTTTYQEDMESKHGATNRDWVKKTNTLSTLWPKTNWTETEDVPSKPAPEFIDIPDQLIAACWQDFTYDGNSIIRYSGNANQLVISWENMSQSSAGVDQTFQMILNRDGTITFQYEYLDGSDVWPNAVVGLRDSGGDWTTSADLLFPDQESIPGTVTVTTHYDTTTNWMKWDGSITNEPHRDYPTEIITTNGTNVVTTPHETVEEQAIMFYPSERVVITVDPTYGTLPFGGSSIHTVYGDARSLTAGGTKSVTVDTTFAINYGFGTTDVDVEFKALNSADTAYAPLKDRDSDNDGRTDVEEATFGSDGFVDVVQNSDGSRTLSWVDPDDSLNRDFTVWYTLDLTSGWTKILPTLGNTTSYRDDDPIRNAAPVIYYKVTVE